MVQNQTQHITQQKGGQYGKDKVMTCLGGLWHGVEWLLGNGFIRGNSQEKLLYFVGKYQKQTDIRGRAISGRSWFESTLFVTAVKSLNLSILQFLHQNKWSIQSFLCHAGCYLWKQFSVSDTGQGGWEMLQHTQDKGGVPFSFHLNSERKAIAGEGLGVASVQDERWVPVIPTESSPVPSFPKADLEQQFVFCRLWKTDLAESCRTALTWGALVLTCILLGAPGSAALGHFASKIQTKAGVQQSREEGRGSACLQLPSGSGEGGGGGGWLPAGCTAASLHRARPAGHPLRQELLLQLGWHGFF